MDGLWTAEFGSSEGVFGGGVVVFRGGRLLGGDSGYYYVGSYKSTGETFTAIVKVRQFVEGHSSVFKSLHGEFTLNLTGRLKDKDHAIARGIPDGMPGMDLGVVLTRRDAAKTD